MTKILSSITEHPMFPTFLEIASIMGNAANHPENEKSSERLGEMDDLARMSYEILFAKPRHTREELALFIATLMSIYWEQFLDEERVEQ